MRRRGACRRDGNRCWPSPCLIRPQILSAIGERLMAVSRDQGNELSLRVARSVGYQEPAQAPVYAIL